MNDHVKSRIRKMALMIVPVRVSSVVRVAVVMLLISLCMSASAFMPHQPLHLSMPLPFYTLNVNIHNGHGHGHVNNNGHVYRLAEQRNRDTTDPYARLVPRRFFHHNKLQHFHVNDRKYILIIE
jgi:hypothetical protein